MLHVTELRDLQEQRPRIERLRMQLDHGRQKSLRIAGPRGGDEVRGKAEMARLIGAPDVGE